MHYTIVVKAPRGHLRRQCRLTEDGRYILFEGVKPRREVMELARRASNFAESVHVVWSSERSLSRGWRADQVTGRPA
jgi:hypothetical protein